MSAPSNQRSEGPPPERRLHSLRRTCSYQTYWRDGLADPMDMICRSRDLYTGADKTAPLVMGEEWLEVQLSPQRNVERLVASRCQDEIGLFAGLRPGGPLRKAMMLSLPDEVANATLLHRLLDDLAGAVFATPMGWIAWKPENWLDQFRDMLGEDNGFDIDVTNICTGFKDGSAALKPDGRTNFDIQAHVLAQPPVSDDDEYAWHKLETGETANAWRLRRMDAWLEDGLVHVDAWFQDSGAKQDGLRRVYHEYRLAATVEPVEMKLASIDVTPIILPYGECRSAAPNSDRLVGLPVGSFDKQVPATLPGAAGCTHLNDVMRTLKDIVSMAATLRKHAAEVV